MNAAELEHYSTTTENNPLQLVKFEEFEQMYSCKIKIAVCKFRSIYRCVCVCANQRGLQHDQRVVDYGRGLG